MSVWKGDQQFRGVADLDGPCAFTDDGADYTSTPLNQSGSSTLFQQFLLRTFKTATWVFSALTLRV